MTFSRDFIFVAESASARHVYSSFGTFNALLPTEVRPVTTKVRVRARELDRAYALRRCNASHVLCEQRSPYPSHLFVLLSLSLVPGFNIRLPSDVENRGVVP